MSREWNVMSEHLNSLLQWFSSCGPDTTCWFYSIFHCFVVLMWVVFVLINLNCFEWFFLHLKIREKNWRHREYIETSCKASPSPSLTQIPPSFLLQVQLWQPMCGLWDLFFQLANHLWFASQGCCQRSTGGGSHVPQSYSGATFPSMPPVIFGGYWFLHISQLSTSDGRVLCGLYLHCKR